MRLMMFKKIRMTRYMLLGLCMSASLACHAGVHSMKVSAFNGFTGRGNVGERMLAAEIVCDALGGTLQAVTVGIRADAVKDIGGIGLRVFDAGGRSLASGVCGFRRHGRSVWKAELVFDVPVPISDTVRIEVTADISPTATEGHTLTAEIEKIRVDGRSCRPDESAVACREILLCRTRLYAPGDYGSQNWRIPALATLPDGTLLAVNDKRKYNESDLPADIDIVARRSTDNGKTWSDPVNIAVGTGYKKGFGDPALIVTPQGGILCLFVGGNYLWHSTPEDPQYSYISRSSDGGRTWSSPENITSEIWGTDATNSRCREYTYSFFGSGNGTVLKRGAHAGRIILAAAMGPAQNLNNHAVYSDDGGRTWHVSDIAFLGGDEAKIVELTDGRLLMSVRRQGARGYNVSEDGGETWGRQGLWPEIDANACNGDMIRYAAEDDGDGYNLLLHSVPYDKTRRNVSIFVSYDEGKTWVAAKTLCPYESAYSSLTVLKDGTIGIYIEENPTPAGCELWFMNFSIDWLRGSLSENCF